MKVQGPVKIDRVEVSNPDVFRKKIKDGVVPVVMRSSNSQNSAIGVSTF